MHNLEIYVIYSSMKNRYLKAIYLFIYQENTSQFIRGQQVTKKKWLKILFAETYFHHPYLTQPLIVPENNLDSLRFIDIIPISNVNVTW